MVLLLRLRNLLAAEWVAAGPPPTGSGSGPEFGKIIGYSAAGWSWGDARIKEFPN